MYRGVLLYVLVIVAVPIALLQPFNGLLIYLWVSFGRPGDFVWHEYTFDYAVWIAAATIIGYLVFEASRSPIRLKGMGLLILLWLWFAATSITAQIPSIAFPKLWEYSRVFVMAFLTYAMANSEKRIRSILYVLAVSLGLLGAKGALDAVTTGFSTSLKGPGGMLSEQNEYALALNMGIPMLVWLAKDDPRKWVRISFRLMALGCAIVVVGTRSRSGLLGLITAAVLLALFSKHKALLGAGMAVSLALLLLFGPQGALQRYKTIPTAAQTDGSAIGRLQAWRAAIRMTQAHPITGVGPRNFLYVFPHYSDDPPRVTHNVIFDMLAETGIPGCLIFLSMIFAAIGEMFVMRRKSQRDPENRHLATYCLIVMGTLIVYLVPNMFINRQDFDLLYQFIGIECGLAALLRLKKASESQPGLEVSPGGVTPLWARALGHADASVKAGELNPEVS